MSRWLLFASLAVGCAKPVPMPTAVEPIGHPDLQCPPGTEPTGVGPPHGLDAWCSQPLANGTTQRSGPSLTWHTNGQLKSQGSYATNKRTGPWLFWFPTGSPDMQGNYQLGKQSGMWTHYQPNGERKSEGNMVDGKEDGPWVFWNDDLTRSEGVYVLGERDGEWLDYGANDQPVRERIYRNGRMVSHREL